MQKLSLGLLLVCAFFVVACNNTKKPRKHKKEEPIVVCKSADCMQTMNWLISFHKNDFPENVEIRISNMSILNECDPNTHFQIDHDGDSVQIIIYDFMALPPDRSFNIALDVKDLGNCYEAKKDYYYKAAQEYSVTTIENRKHVIIDQTN